MTIPMQYRETNVPDVRKFPHTPSKNNTTTTSTGSSTSSSSSTTTVEFCQDMADEQLLRNRVELLRGQYRETIGRDMPMSAMRQLLLALIGGTPWQYYEYALEETALAPAPSWRYAMAIVNRLITQAVPVDRLRDPKPRKQGRVLAEQDYTQREYHHSDDPVDRMMAEWFASQNGEEVNV